jgi:hypothetical protein
MAEQASCTWRRLSAALVVLGISIAGAMAEPADGRTGSDRFAASSLISEPKLSVRQGGDGDGKGLLSRLRGPAATIDFSDSRGDTFRSLAGAMEGGPGGKQQGYVGGSGRASLLDLGLVLNYAADELGSSVIETRVEKPVGDLKLALSRTYNHDFESRWTGFGPDRARDMTEGSIDWTPLSAVPMNFAVRETNHADGRDTTDFRTVQTLMLAGGMVVNSTATAMLGASGTGPTSGSLLYYGPAGPVQLTMGVDYGGLYGMHPGVARLGVEKSLRNSWSLYAYGEQGLAASGSARFDVGAVRDVGGFTLATFAGGARDGSGYAGLRLSVPLAPEARDYRWMGF